MKLNLCYTLVLTAVIILSACGTKPGSPSQQTESTGGQSMPTSGSGYTGKWNTTYGPMTLSQTGNQVQGIYVMNGQKCQIQGTVSGGSLTFSYTEPNATGRGSFELSTDGKSFQGTWVENGSSHQTYVWKGIR